MLGTVGRLGSVLDLFTEDRPEWGATELAKAMKVAKSQAHEILASMTATGLLQRTPGARYRLGWRTVRLGAVAMRNEGIAETGALWMRRLVTMHPELSAHVAAWDLDRAIYVGRQVGAGVDGGVARMSTVGSEAQLHCTSLGKVLAASQSAAALDAILTTKSLERYTVDTITCRDALHRELITIRERGYAIDRGELQRGMVCLAAPITDADDRIVAALGIVLPSNGSRPGAETYLQSLIDTARRISRGIRAPRPVVQVPA